MSVVKVNGGPAFPLWNPDMNLGDDAGPGMSLRDWFAGKALVGIISHHRSQDCNGRAEVCAIAFEIADAMLKAREATA